MLASLPPPVCQVVNFTSPLTVPQGCWRLLSLQLLHKALPVHLLSSLRLDSSLGAPLLIPLYLQSGLGKVEPQSAVARLLWAGCYCTGRWCYV